MKGRIRAGIGVALLLGAGPAIGQPATDAAPRRIVERAFERTLHAPGVRSVELRVHRDGRLVARRAFDVAYQRDAGGARSLLRFTAPSYLRGQALLVVEAPGGGTDTWLYQSEERRPRRVGSANRADSFYGSDLSFEDLEHPHWDRFALRPLPDDRDLDRACAVIEAGPPPDSQYDRLVLWIERERQALVRIDFYRAGGGEPDKRLRVALDGVEEEGGFLRVRHVRVEQVGRDAWTDVETLRQAIDPDLPSDVFSASFLEREGQDLYAWVGRHATTGEAP